MTDATAESVDLTASGNYEGQVIPVIGSPTSLVFAGITPSGHTGTLSLSGDVITTTTSVCPTPAPTATSVTARVLVTDATGVPAAGVPVVFSVDAPALIVGDATVMSGPDGVAEVEVSVDPANAPDSFEVRATLEGLPVSGSPATITVDAQSTGAFVSPVVTMAAAPSAGPGPVPADGVASWTVTFAALDECGLPAAGVDVALAVQGDAVLSAGTVTTDADGLATAIVTDTTAESVDVSATTVVGGATMTVAGSPVTVEFAPLPPPVYLGTLTLSSDGVSMLYGGCPGMGGQSPAELTATVAVRDTVGAPVSGAAVEFGVDAPLVLDPASAHAVTAADGTATVALSVDWGSVSGPMMPSVHATIAGGGTITPAMVAVSVITATTPAPPVPRLSVSPTGDSPVLADGSSSWTATAEVIWCDAPVPNADIAFTASGSAVVSVPSVKTDASGKAVVTVTDTVAETVQVTAGLDLETDSASIEFVPVPAQVYTGALSLSVPGILVVPGKCDKPTTVSDDSFTATVMVTDETGAPAAGVPVTFAVDAPMAIDGPATVDTDAGGMARVTVRVDAAAYVTGMNTSPGPSVRASIGGVAVAGSPAGDLFSQLEDMPVIVDGFFTLTTAPTAGPGPVPADGAASWTATVEATDECGVALPDAPVTFTVTGDAVLSSSTVSTDADGRAVVTVTDATAESVQVSASAVYKGVPVDAVPGSPSTIEFATVVTPAFVTHLWVPASPVAVTPPQCGNPTAVDPQTVPASVYVNDQDGNPVPGVKVDFAVDAPLVIQGSSSATTDASGEAAITLKVDATQALGATQAGVRASIGGVPVDDSPATVRFSTPAATLPPLSQLVSLMYAPTAGPGAVAADGSASWTVAVAAVDQCGVPAPDVAVGFSATGDAVLSATSLKTGADGRALVTVTDTTAETVEVHATVSYQDYTQDAPGSPVSLTFVADAGPAPTVSASAAVTTDRQPAGGGQDVVTVTVLADGAPAPGAWVWATSDDPRVTVQPAITPTGADGTTTIWVMSSAAGAYSVTVSVAGVDQVTGSPLTVTFGTPPPAAPVVNGANATWIAGTAPAGTTVEVTYPVAGGGTAVVTGPVDATGAWTVDTPADAVSGTLSVVAIGDDGQRSAAATFPLSLEAAHIAILTVAPVQVSVVADPYRCGDPTVVVSPETLRASVVVTTQDGVPAAGAMVDFTVDAPLVIDGSASVPTDAAGVATVTVTVDAAHAKAPAQAGVRASVDGVAAAGSPAWVAFVTGAPSTSPDLASLVSVSKAPTSGSTPVVADGTDSWTIAVTAVDPCGTPRIGIVFGFSLVGSHAVLSETSVTTDAAGKASITVTDATPETVQVLATVTYQGATLSVPGSPLSLAFGGPQEPIVPGAPSLASSGTGSSLFLLGAGFAPGESLTLSVDGSIVSLPVPLSADASGGVTIPVPPGMFAAGTYNVTLTGVTSGLSASTTITIQPTTTTAPPGEVAVAVSGTGSNQVLTGTGFAPGETVALTVTGTTVPLVTRQADASGTVTIPVPSSLPAGTYDVTLTGATSGSHASTTVTIVASETTPPETTAPPEPGTDAGAPKVSATVSGGAVTLAGAGFAPNETVNVVLMLGAAPVTLASVTADAKGVVTWSGTVPASVPAGTYTVTMTGATSAKTASTSVTIAASTTPPTTAPVAPGAPAITVTTSGRSFSVTGTGFAPGENVTVALVSPPTPLGAQKADASGKVTFTMTMPPAVPDGTYAITMTGVTSGRTAQASVKVGTAAAPAVGVASTGRSYVFTGTGFAPGEKVSGMVYSTPVDLGSVTANASGTAVFVWIAPPDFAAGSHRVVLTGTSGATAQTTFTVPGITIPTGGTSHVPGWGWAPATTLGCLLAALVSIVLFMRSRMIVGVGPRHPR
ncbi:MAG: Ig-like domain-containing protein [Actinomycetia bacterium]|nr:Ig-like domain-containing protein [Actinomycetes bacterium]